MQPNNEGKDFSVTELNSLLKKLISARVAGNTETERALYEQCHSLMKLMIDKSEPQFRQKRIKQLRQLEDGYAFSGSQRESVIDDTHGTAKETLKEMGIEVVNSPNVRLSDIAGLDAVKEEVLAKIIYPINYRELSVEYDVQFGGGILLYGPPGTGKTQMARAIASESRAYFINVNPSVLFSEWFGKFEKNINLLFKAARELSPSVVFFDEVDTLLPSREDSRSDVVKRGVSQLLMEIGGMHDDDQRRIFVLAATNNPWQLDRAFLRPGRFDEKIYVGLPDASAREKLFKDHLLSQAISSNINFQLLSEMTLGYTGADIEYICRRAKQDVFMEVVRTGERRTVKIDDIISVIHRAPRSVDQDIIDRYVEFENLR